MKYYSVVTWIVMGVRGDKKGVDLVIVDYRCNKKVLTFFMKRAAGSAVPGNPYQ